MNHSRSLSTAAAVLTALATLCSSQATSQFRLDRDGGALGKTLNLELNGPNGSGFVMIPSLNAGPLPLSILDASDTRSMEIGLDLTSLLLSGAFSGSKITVPYPIPSDNSLLGQTLHFQGFLFPGATRLAGTLSNPLRASFGQTSAWTSRGKVFATTTAIPTTSELPDRRILLAGGGTGNLLSARGLDNSEIYDPDRQNFAPGPKLTTPRALHQAVTLANGKVLLIGGADAQGIALATCELYDPIANTFAAGPSMSTARAGHTATLLPNGNVLVAGGSSDLTDATKAVFGTKSSCELYNASTNSWSSARSMSRVRLGHAATLLPNGRVLVSGGATITFFVIPSVTNTAEIYNPATNSWAGTGSMTYSAGAHIFQPLKDGRVLAIGGAVLQNLTNITSTNRCSVFTPSTGRWTAGGNLLKDRALPATVQVPDGRVLTIGGAQGSLTAPLALATCEWFDITTLQWSSAPSLGTSRAGNVALLRPEGIVFVAGGAGGPSNISLDTGEILYVK